VADYLKDKLVSDGDVAAVVDVLCDKKKRDRVYPDAVDMDGKLRDTKKDLNKLWNRIMDSVIGYPLPLPAANGIIPLTVLERNSVVRAVLRAWRVKKGDAPFPVSFMVQAFVRYGETKVCYVVDCDTSIF